MNLFLDFVTPDRFMSFSRSLTLTLTRKLPFPLIFLWIYGFLQWQQLYIWLTETFCLSPLCLWKIRPFMISGKTPIFDTGGLKHDHVRQKWTFSLITKKIPELQKRFNDLILRFRHAGSIYVIFNVRSLTLTLTLTRKLPYPLFFL